MDINKINVLDSIYLKGSLKHQVPQLKKVEKRANLLSLIVTCIVKYCPSFENLSEKKFMAFQEELFSIVNKTIKNEDL